MKKLLRIKNKKLPFEKIFTKDSPQNYQRGETFVKISRSKINTGFTLIELLVVIAIISFISIIIYANLQDARNRAQATKIVAETDQLSKAIELYKNDKGTYPGEKDNASYNGASVIDFLNNELVFSKYISVIPQYGISYYYRAGNKVKIDPKWGRPPMKCGGKIVDNYIFIFEDPNLNLDFPRLDIEVDSEGFESAVVGYCIGQ
jgi:prepilin-type N-terminal cleavage/methylation domain-containing protein